MVKALHTAPVGVILDVVYNHTAEGNHLGFDVVDAAGVDNHAYYRLVDDDPRQYLDFTGTGNSLNARSPHVLQLIMDSLRYWVFPVRRRLPLRSRFDIAASCSPSTACRRSSISSSGPRRLVGEADRRALGRQGGGGYQVGNFPPLWSEWNGRYRDTIRDFWRGEPTRSASSASGSATPTCTGRLAAADGLDQLHHRPRRVPARRLRRLQLQAQQANGEGERDGESHNQSWNCGVEGSTDDPAVVALRQRQRRQHDDDVAAVAGCADDPRWRRARTDPAREQQRLLPGRADLLVRLGTRRHRVPRVVPSADRPAQGASRLPPAPLVQRHAIRDTAEIVWLRPDGQRMSDTDWATGYTKAIRVLLDGEAISTPDRFGVRRRRHVLRDAQRQRARPAVDVAVEAASRETPGRSVDRAARHRAATRGESDVPQTPPATLVQPVDPRLAIGPS